MVIALYDDMSLELLTSLVHCICDCSSSTQLPIPSASVAELGDQLSRLEEVYRLSITFEELNTGGNADH